MPALQSMQAWLFCKIRNYKGFLAMRLFIAIFLPWLSFFFIGKPIAGIFCLILQLTLIGWIPAAIWAVYSLSQWKTDQKIKQALSERTK